MTAENLFLRMGREKVVRLKEIKLTQVSPLNLKNLSLTFLLTESVGIFVFVFVFVFHPFLTHLEKQRITLSRRIHRKGTERSHTCSHGMFAHLTELLYSL